MREWGLLSGAGGAAAEADQSLVFRAEALMEMVKTEIDRCELWMPSAPDIHFETSFTAVGKRYHPCVPCFIWPILTTDF